MHAPSIEWTDERVRDLTRMCDEGMSARLMAIEFGITRNAVIGKVTRLGLQFRVKPRRRLIQPRLQPPPKPPPKPKPPPEPEPEPIIEQPEPIALTFEPCSIMELSAVRCRWPMWRDDGVGERLYCGALPLAGSRYCAEHARRAYGRDREPGRC